MSPEVTVIASDDSAPLDEVAGVAGLDRFDVSIVSDAAGIDPAEVGCVVCTLRDGWVEAVERLRADAPGVPVLLAGDRSAGDAALASRLGVEFASTDALHDTDETLASRITAALSRAPDERTSATTDESDRNERALRELHAVSTADEDFPTKLRRILDIGQTYLGVEVGFATDIDTETERLRMLAVTGDAPFAAGESFPLARAFCKETIERDGLLAVADANAEGWADDPATDSGLQCYLGGSLSANGERYGTVCFGSTSPRDRPFSDAERAFVELLVDWASHELERERRESELAETRDQLKTVLERIEDGFFAVDTDWQFTYINDTGYEILESAVADPADREALPGADLWTAVPDAVGTEFEAQYRRAMETQQPTEFEARFGPSDAWFGVNAYPSEEGLSVFLQDISERKRREDALSTLLSTTRELMAASDREAIADVVRDAAADVIGLEYTLVRLYDRDRNVLVPAARSEAVAREMSDRPLYEPGEGLPGRAFERGEMLTYAGDESVLPGDPGMLASAYCFPLGEQGTLTVGSSESTPFEEDRRALASLLAANATAALDRAEREARLRRYRAIHENVREMVYVIDEDGTLQECTDALLDRLGYDRDAVVGEFVGTFLADDALATGRDYLKTLVATDLDGSRTIETTLLTADGEEVPVDIELSLLDTDDGFAGSVGVVHDRSELEAERSRFANLFEREPAAVVDAAVTDDGAVVRRVNPAFADTFGVDPDAAPGRRLDELVAPAADRLDELAGKGVDDPIEIERQTPEGLRTFLFQAVRYGTSEDGPLVFGIYTDITERKESERRIRMLNRVFRHNIANTNGVVTGYLDLLVDRLDGEAATFAEKALEAATRVDDIAASLRKIERTVDHRTGDDTSPLSEIVGAAATTARDAYPALTVEYDVPPASVGGGVLLETALDELLENVAVHAGEAPTVEIDGRVADGTITLRVTDDGPGIPRREREVLSGDSDIDQLEHSRGLGLWLVHHASASLGGSLEFADDGRTVVLELPVVA